jgi:hypothetical protein
MRIRKAAMAPLAAALAAFALPAAACGFCVEDRVAAVYHQGAVDSARATRRAVAFVGFEGGPADGGATRGALVAALEASGAARGSIRVSLESGACAFVYDPARVELPKLLAEANRRLGDRRLAMGVLRWIDEAGALREP